jgi:hypothetical protein
LNKSILKNQDDKEKMGFGISPLFSHMLILFQCLWMDGPETGSHDGARPGQTILKPEQRNHFLE